MKSLILTGVVALLPMAAVAGSSSAVVQIGIGNTQETIQNGSSTAVTFQRGQGNSASTVISGGPKASVIIQSGNGFEREVILTDDDTVGVSSLQARLPRAGYSRNVTVTVENGLGRLVLQFDFEDPEEEDD